MSKDFPLTFWIKFDNPGTVEANLTALGLPKVSAAKAKARLRVAAAAVAAADTGRSVSYSRNTNFYTSQKRYQGSDFTFANVTQTVDEYAAFDLVEEIRARPGSHLLKKPKQSRFRATPKLLQLCKDQLYSFNEQELIRVKGDNDRLCDYRDTPETNLMRSELLAVNAELAKIRVKLTTPNLHYERGYLIINGSYIRPEAPRLVRMFCRGRFDRGGRYYGWWQNLPKQVRQAMLLNGEPVCELDFASIHANLLYAEAGLAMVGDPYQVGGYDRAVGKLAFNVAVNAPTRQIANGALQRQLSLSKTDASALRKAVEAQHSGLKGAFGTDAGVRLMKRDSDIIFNALKDLQQAGIPALPVHDSMIAPERHRDKVRECMLESYKKLTGGKLIVVR